MSYDRHPTQEELDEAQVAYEEWRKTHEQLAVLKKSRVIFSHGYLTHLLREESKE
ncbi:MAG TPA: hypothetical protein VNS88_04775 [Nitrospiraceae bacterium]|nr:hypothetical protein [Nitrospiraceae bacterium]